MKFIFVTILLGVSIFLQGQGPISVCKGCEKLNKPLKSKSPHTRFGAMANDENQVYLYAEDHEWLQRTLRRWWSGISLEYVTVCDSFCIPDSEPKIIYHQHYYHKRKDLKRRMVYDTVRNLGFIPMENVPEHLQEEKYDINVLFTHKGRNCQRFAFFPSHKSNYRLPLSYQQDPEEALRKFLKSLEGEQAPIRDTLEYYSQFEQNESTAPYVYAEFFKDSLGSNHYFLHMDNNDSVQIKDIKQLDIRAFASIEGESEENIDLARNRANYMRDIFVRWGVDSNKISISYEENWDLYKRQKNTVKYAGLSRYSNTEIKELLNDTAVQGRLEELLVDQRKSYLTIYTEKLHPVQLLSSGELLDSFNTALENHAYMSAAVFRYELYRRIGEGEMNDSALALIVDTLDFLDKHNYFKHLLNPNTEQYSFWTIKSLLKGNEKDGELQFYRLRKKLNYLRLEEERADKFKLKKEIKKLGSLGVPSAQVNRMLINYNFSMAEEYKKYLSYKTKTRTLKSASKLVARINLSLEEDLEIAKFFDHMSERELAVKSIQEYINNGSYNEEVLFTYLFLTLPYLEKYKDNSYMLLIENAREMNNERFMRFFDPSVFSAAAIELLRDENMREVYCGGIN